MRVSLRSCRRQEGHDTHGRRALQVSQLMERWSHGVVPCHTVTFLLCQQLSRRPTQRAHRRCAARVYIIRSPRAARGGPEVSRSSAVQRMQRAQSWVPWRRSACSVACGRRARCHRGRWPFAAGWRRSLAASAVCSASATACRSSWKRATLTSKVCTRPSVNRVRNRRQGRSTRETLLVESTTSTRHLRGCERNVGNAEATRSPARTASSPTAPESCSPPSSLRREKFYAKQVNQERGSRQGEKRASIYCALAA
jgi:hypothetical protein